MCACAQWSRSVLRRELLPASCWYCFRISKMMRLIAAKYLCILVSVVFAAAQKCVPETTEAASMYLPDVPEHVAQLMKIMFAEIFCSGYILDAIQSARLFNDSKYFVDMSLKKDPISTAMAFRELGDKVKDPAVVARFIVDYFDPPETELISCHPIDWVPVPMKFDRVKNYDYRRWLMALHYQWIDLCRQVRPDLKDHPQLYTSVYVPHSFIIPGGRFREFYYWDSFWILKGLLFSELYSTSRGMMRNMAYLVENNGFVPNGGRVYLLSRSQPPVLVAMVYEYYSTTRDETFVREMLPYLEKEYQFWRRQRSYAFHEGGNECNVFRYGTESTGPRPESYREDLELVKDMSNEQDRLDAWANIASAAESGWDFSTRWFSTTGPSSYEMKSIRTRKVIPVDLNAFMCMNARMLSELLELVGDDLKALYYRNRYKEAIATMKQLHWNEDDGVWYDFDLQSKSHLEAFYISNIVPLYAKCYDDPTVPKRVYEYMVRQGVFSLSGGFPTSFLKAVQQWDGANAWPPMVHMVVEGFRTSGDRKLADIATTLATRWLASLYKVYANSSLMYEKYKISAEDISAGGGGEYVVQTGFGWTNGVIMDFFDKFGDSLLSITPPTFWQRMLAFVRKRLFRFINVIRVSGNSRD